MTTDELLQENLTTLFKRVVAELQEEPEFKRKGKPLYAVENGTPSIKVAAGNIPLNYDLWKNLRNPAVVGLYPVGLQKIWEFYAHTKKRGIDTSGRSTIFQVPQPFDSAMKKYSRAVIISVMLPFSPDSIKEYTELVGDREGSSHVYYSMYDDVDTMVDRAVSRAALGLVRDNNVVVPMHKDNVIKVSKEAVPVTRQGSSHGPAKGGNYPQKSVAALLGLGQFGVHRIIFRDEVVSGKVQRLTGPLRSIIIFDRNQLITDGEGMIYPGDQWRQFLFKLYDFTNTDSEVNKYRFCTYQPLNDEGCGFCKVYCPSGAQANSMPDTTGEYSKEIVQQQHRFWEGKLQFDYARCCEERGQMASLFNEWSCSRALSVCASKGRKRKYAAENFYKKMWELTRQ